MLPSSLFLAWDLLRSKRPLSHDARWLPLVGGGGWMLVFSAMSRRAVRYAFPVLPLFHLAGAETVAHRWPGLTLRVARLRPYAPYLAMLWILTVTAVRSFLESRWYRFINPL